MNENSTLYFYLVVMILGIVLIAKGLRDQYLENKRRLPLMQLSLINNG